MTTESHTPPTFETFPDLLTFLMKEEDEYNKELMELYKDLPYALKSGGNRGILFSPSHVCRQFTNCAMGYAKTEEEIRFSVVLQEKEELPIFYATQDKKGNVEIREAWFNKVTLKSVERPEWMDELNAQKEDKQKT